MKKSSIAIIIAATLAIACSGCNGIAKNGGVETPNSSEVSTSAQPKATPTAVDVIYGKVIDAANANVTVEANDGKSYTILKDDNTVVHSDNGIVIGDNVEIAYVGNLNDNSAVAHSIIITSESEMRIAPTPIPASNTSKKKQSNAIKYFTGECMDISMHNIQMKYENNTYSIAKDDNTVTVGNIAVGDTIRVFHKGDIENGMNATKVVLVSKAKASSSDDFKSKTLYGNIKAASNASIMITNTNGSDITILKDDNTKVNSDISIGTSVEVICYVTDDGQLMATVIN